VFLPAFTFLLTDGYTALFLEQKEFRMRTHAVLICLLAGGVSAAAQPAIPPALEVPAGHSLFLATHAEGTQNYICLLAPSGLAWRFLGPQATLFDTESVVRQQLATHFLSVNPADSLARPAWQHSIDSSRVWGRVVATSSDPSYVGAGAIPWLLLAAAGNESGPAGGTLLADTTFIQRVNTSGGVAPATGCSRAQHIGTVALVPYSTDYFFYRADR
jgi:hypothetical protein